MCKTIRNTLKIIAGVKFNISSEEQYDHNRPLLVISNHQSMYDVSLLTEVFNSHQPRFISKKELGKWVPAVSFIARNNKTALIDRKNRTQALAEIERVARLTFAEKAALIIFPEGTRARDGQMKPFKRAGIASILTQIPQATIIPVAISGSWQILRYGLFPIPHKTVVNLKCLPSIKWDISCESMNTESIIDNIENAIKKHLEPV
jgi:1-acyl-sn-glycerol-3-phosphate acyltransferase